MGVKLIILLAVILGILYVLHLLVKDYQAITAGSRLLRLLFKRDLTSQQRKPFVRWKLIDAHDSAQCVRVVYCGVGAHAAQSPLQSGFLYMLTVAPRAEDAPSLQEFKQAYHVGVRASATGDQDACGRNYPQCPFNSYTLFRMIDFLLKREGSS